MGYQERVAPILVNPEIEVYHGGTDPRKASVRLGW
jgi:hypothetical protein